MSRQIESWHWKLRTADVLRSECPPESKLLRHGSVLFAWRSLGPRTRTKLWLSPISIWEVLLLHQKVAFLLGWQSGKITGAIGLAGSHLRIIRLRVNLQR